ncbi:MAG: molybdopterin cofactor-binding domain-containing protein [Chloroflexota bacterium]
MTNGIELIVNGTSHWVTAVPETPLLYVLRNDLGLKGPKYGCGQEQCNACKVLVDGQDVPSCKLPIEQVAGLSITTVEGLGSAEHPHPLQEAFAAEQAIQCGYCAAGMVIAAQGLLNRTRYPSDNDIRTALADNLCRCGVYERVRRAIKLRIGRPHWEPIYEIITATDPATPAAAGLPPSIAQTPDLDGWIRINADETVTIFSGKVEIGQGIKTAVSQIAAEELDVALSRICIISGDTGQVPDEGLTAGSMSVEVSGRALRVAAAEARHWLLTLAFEELEASDLTNLQINDGVITDPATGRQTSYWKLMGGKRFGRTISGTIPPKDPAAYTLIGQPAPRADLLPKLTGVPSYVHDLELPGMVHGRVVRPPSYGARLVAVEETAVSQLPGVLAVIRDGNFLAVIAEREEQAIWASEALRANATWHDHAPLPTPDTLYDHLLNQPAESVLIKDGTAVTDPIPPAVASPTLQASYYRPYQMHGSLGPSAAVAQWQDGQLTVWSHTQGPFILQAALAEALALSPQQVRVIHTEGAGTYGHNGADDAAMDGALLALALPGRPVLLKWMRDDEHSWEPYGPAMVVKLAATLSDGHITGWNHDVWSYPHMGRPRPMGDSSGLVAAWHRKRPFPRTPPRLIMGNHAGSYRNADPLYDFAHKRVVAHHVPNSPLRTSSLRSLGAYANIFAIESFMDELAHAASVDPVAFRLAHLADQRAKTVIEAAAHKAGWANYQASDGRGLGIAFAQYKNRQCYAAIAVEVAVNRETGAIKLLRAIIAADAGQIVNPDGMSNQLEGGFVQASSWTLAEAVDFAPDGIRSRDWDNYPVLRFDNVPTIETVLINRPHLPFLGVGEATQNPTPAAIANAVFAAVGVRLREIPFTPARVLAALATPI